MQAVNAAPWFKELLKEHQPPCVSIYLPSGRAEVPGQTPVHFQNALDDVRAAIGGRQGYGADQRQQTLQRLEQAMSDSNLWQGDREGLAFFVSANHAHVIELRQPVERTVIVADTFHVKPLIRALQQSQRYRVLLVSLRSIRMFEGSQHSLREVELHRAVPRSADDPIVQQSTTTDTTPQGTGNTTPLENQPSYPPGSVPIDRYYRLVDQAVWEYYSRIDPVPLLVVADVKTLSGYQAIAKDPNVHKEGIKLNPEAATPDRLREEAWKILSPQFEQQIQTLKDGYQAAKARQLGSDEIPMVAEAAATGRVGTLLVDSDAKVPGILHRDSGFIEQAAMSNPRADDVLDDLAEMVLKMDGQVFVLPHDQMPTDQGVAAVYRY